MLTLTDFEEPQDESWPLFEAFVPHKRTKEHCHGLVDNIKEPAQTRRKARDIFSMGFHCSRNHESSRHQ